MHSKRQKGFSLTELSVSMTIIALVAGSALSVAITSDFNAKKSQTQSKLDRIEEAMAGYLGINRRLPCPADGELTPANANFGLEGTPDVTGCTDSNFDDTADVFTGVVPVRTLQLPDDFMFDGWGRRYTYAVDYRFANNDNTNPDCDGGVTSDICFIDTPAGSITVQDGSGGNRTLTAVYVILSHGQNGHGAFTKNGSATRVNAYAASLANPYDYTGELENAHLDTNGADTAYNAVFLLRDDVATEGGEYFDDIVRFKLKSHLIKDAGAVFFESLCRDARSIVDSGNNACTGAGGEDDCEQFATEINERCLSLD